MAGKSTSDAILYRARDASLVTSIAILMRVRMLNISRANTPVMLKMVIPRYRIACAQSISQRHGQIPLWICANSEL